jgi:hypothetical protein
MKTIYKTPKLTEIEIDRAASLNLQSALVLEPGDGGAGAGGAGDGTGNDWTRTGIYENERQNSTLWGY